MEGSHYYCYCYCKFVWRSSRRNGSVSLVKPGSEWTKRNRLERLRIPSIGRPADSFRLWSFFREKGSKVNGPSCRFRNDNASVFPSHSWDRIEANRSTCFPHSLSLLSIKRIKLTTPRPSFHLQKTTSKASFHTAKRHRPALPFQRENRSRCLLRSQSPTPRLPVLEASASSPNRVIEWSRCGVWCIREWARNQRSHFRCVVPDGKR